MIRDTLRGPDGGGLGPVGHTGSVSDIETDNEAEFEGSPRPPTKVPGVWKQMPVAIKIALVLLVLVAGGAILVASHETSQSQAQFDNGVVEQLIPNNGDKILQQDQVGIRLADGYTGSLVVNGLPVPDDQVDKVQALNEVLFQPGDGKVVQDWPAGQNCVVASYWKYETPADVSSHTWCFSGV